MSAINYTPPPTIKEFMLDYIPGELFYDWIIGPVGSGKTTGIFFKLVRMASLQAPGPDGVRRSRAVVVRNTNPQLQDTTLKSWFTWFRDGQAGEWKVTDKTFILRFGDVECEVLFRPLDTPQDVARVLSLEVTFAIVDEFVEIPRAIIDALSARCGRYPSAVNGGATNWGMWGSSNPSTEDNWWFDYLHDMSVHVQPAEAPIYPLGHNSGPALDELREGRNARYFLQPSGFAENAENIENLPGGRAYYDNQAKGKSPAWINQFLKAEWGFSVAGKPVVPSFNAAIHLKKKLLFNPLLPLVGGYDPGLGGSAMIFGQEDHDGRLIVLGELIQAGYGVTRFVSERLRPYLRRRFGENVDFLIAPDPAAGNRASNDEKTAVEILKRFYPVSIETNNRLPLRLDAIEHYTTKLVEGQPALIVDPDECPTLVRALKGGWRYALDKQENPKADVPEKNQYSHPGDAFGYLARHFHRQVIRNERYTASGAKPFTPPKRFGGMGYHAR